MDNVAEIIRLRAEAERLQTALKTIRDLPVEEQDNTISANMRMIAGVALAPAAEITESDIAWALKVLKEPQPLKAYVPCHAHRGQTWEMTFTATAATVVQVCPICEKEQGEKK